jgi:co-chaperonin GroES (HSP10)
VCSSDLVIIKAKKNTEVVTPDGKILLVPDPDAWMQYESTPMRGLVIRAPQESNSTEWETPVEIQDGDEIFFDYKAAMRAVMKHDPKLVFVIDLSEVYMMIPYEECYAKFVGEDIIPINGVILGVRMKARTDGQHLLLPKIYHDDPFRVKIEQIAAPVKYKSELDLNLDGQIKVGDVVITKPYRALPLEHPAYNSMTLVRLMSRDILAVEELVKKKKKRR